LREQADALPELMRPVVIESSLADLPQQLAKRGIRGDRLIGRNALLHEPDKAALIQQLASILHSEGCIVLSLTIARRTQRLYHLVPPEALSAKLYKTWSAAEEQIYQNPADPMVNWDAPDIPSWFAPAHLVVEVQIETTQTELQITADRLAHWFRSGGTRPSYADHLARSLTVSEISKIRKALERQCLNRVVRWHGAIAYILAKQA
jgi:putative ATPase